jgi:hypothetical protein
MEDSARRNMNENETRINANDDAWRCKIKELPVPILQSWDEAVDDKKKKNYLLH